MSGCDGVTLLKIDCLGTLKIQLTPSIVDGVNCFEQKYDGTSIDDLIFGSGNEACTAASTSDSVDNPLVYWGSESLDAAVTSDTSSVYFSLFDCGTTMETIDVNGQANIEFTTTVKGTYRQVGWMILAPSLSSTEIKCRYKTGDTGITINIAAALDGGSSDVDRILQNADIGQVSTDLVSYKILIDGEEYDNSNDVVLGSAVSLSFDSIGPVTDGFHIRSCLATNEVEDKTADDYESLALIAIGCPETSGNLALESINPQISDNTLTYNQFAFVDADDVSQLLFGLECILEFGDQPSCTGGGSRRFSSGEPGKLVKVRIPIGTQKSTTTSSYSPLASSIALGSLICSV